MLDPLVQRMKDYYIANSHYQLLPRTSGYYDSSRIVNDKDIEDDELINVFGGNDGSTPEADKILSEFAEKDRVNYLARIKPMLTLVTIEEVEAAESKLGFMIPSLLRELYMNVGNGGFGPDIMGIDNGWRGGYDGNDTAVDFYLTNYNIAQAGGSEFARLWDKVLKHRLPLASGGCHYYYVLDCRTENGQVLRWNAAGLAEEMGWDLMAHTLREWLEKWLDGENCHIPIIEDYRPV